MIEAFFIALVLWVLVQIVVVLRNKSWRDWTLKTSALAALPLALIVAIEALSPSSEITGYSTPVAPEIQWQPRTAPFSDSPLTWADINHLFHGAGPDGYLTQDSLRAQLHTRGAELIETAKKISLNSIRTDSSILRGLREERLRRVELQQLALTAALDGMDTLFANGPVTPQAAEYWRAEIVHTIAHTEADQTAAAYAEATDQLAAWDVENAALRPSNLKRRALADKVFHAKSAKSRAHTAAEKASALLTTLTQRRAYIRLDHPIEMPPWPLEIATQKTLAKRGAIHASSHSHKDTITGPEKPTGLSERIARTAKMFNNSERSPATVPMDVRCFIKVSAQSGRPRAAKSCEFHIPVLVNYDLTRADCVATATSSCVEAWVLPDLTILLGDDSVTFLPPRPTQAAALPVSRWSVYVFGQTKLLNGPTTFALPAGHTPRLPDYKLRHLPLEDATDVKIWQDFSTAAFLQNEAHLRQDIRLKGSHRFRGHSVDGPYTKFSLESIAKTVWQDPEHPVDPSAQRDRYTGLLTVNYYELEGKRRGCLEQIKTRSYVSNRLERLLPDTPSPIADWIAQGDSCARLNTLATLYDALWPIAPSDVFEAY